jgi:hypothetical protein
MKYEIAMEQRNRPRGILRRMWNLARIMFLQACFKVVRNTDIEMLGFLRCKDINVLHGHESRRTVETRQDVAAFGFLRWLAEA